MPKDKKLAAVKDPLVIPFKGRIKKGKVPAGGTKTLKTKVIGISQPPA